MLSLFILSFIQSITEFLPISSSGHLLLMNKLGISQQTMEMDILLHLGTLLAVVFYFRKDILNLFPVLWGKGDKRLFLNLVIGTLPILLVGFFCFDLIRIYLRSPLLIALNSIFWGIVLWGIDKYFPKKGRIIGMTKRQAFYIGCAQVLSLIPGTSRSGITMTCGRALKMDRTDAAHFSMLLSIPTILMAVGYVGIKGIQGQVQMPVFLTGLSGVVLTALMGIGVISFLMKWVKKSSFGIFALYRVLLGLFVLIYMIV